jgi:integrase
MRGHIEQRSKNKGTWSIKIALGKDSSGKYKYKWYTVQGNKKDAERKLSELLYQLDTGSYIQPGKTTVAEYLDRWLTEYVQPNLSPRGYERYQYIALAYIKPAIGGLLLTQVKPEHIQRCYINWSQRGLSSGTIRYHHAVVHKALQTALKWGLVALNAADGVEIPKLKQIEMQTWNETELSQFLEAAKSSQYYELFYLALFTGMRRSELLALRWQDIDFILGQIYVNRGIHQLRNGSYVFTQPKSTRSRRTIALPPSAIMVLQEYHDKRQMDAAMLDLTLTDSALVFSTYDGKPLRPNTITRAWQTIAARAGVKAIRFHDARHTHATLMLKQGIHPKIVQERLGHASIQMTLDTYSHVAPGLQEAAAQCFDDLVKIHVVANQ